MYNEDQDLGWRAWLQGYRCVLAPRAIMYNKYEFQRSIKKYYYMDRNRIISILKNYRFSTLALIAPAFLLMELGLALYSIKTGWFKDKIRTWLYFFNFDNWKDIYKARKEIQAKRIISEKQIAEMVAGRIWYQEVDDWKLRLINPFFELYWKFVKLFILK